MPAPRRLDRLMAQLGSWRPVTSWDDRIEGGSPE
jgi:hypothetical protein